MEKKKNKGLVITIIILSLLLVLAIGYIANEKLFLEDEVKSDSGKEEVQENEEDFYEIENLIKNHYIKKIETTRIEDVIEIDDNTLYYDKDGDMVKDDTISSPKYVHFALYQLSNVSGYFVLTESGDIYYMEVVYDDNGTSKYGQFTKINTKKALNLYTNVLDPSLDTIYAEFDDGSLMKFENKAFEKTYQEANKYPDKIYRAYSEGGDAALVIDKDKKLYSEDGERILYNNNNEIVLKNGYEVFNGSYSLIVDANDNLLKVSYDQTSAVLYKNEKVKDINFVKSNKDSIKGSLKITLENGEVVDFGEVVPDTIYERNNK